MKKILLIITLFFMQNLFANVKDDVIKYKFDESYANGFSKLIVQSKDGRIKPLDTLNIDILNKISGQRNFYGLNHNQVILGMIYTPILWKKVNMFDISSKQLKKIISSKDKKKYAYIDFFDNRGFYKLQDRVDLLKEKNEKDYNSFEKELVKVNERVKIATFIYNQGFLKIYPMKYTKQWFSPFSLKDNFKNEIKYEAQNLHILNKSAILNSFETKEWDESNKTIKLLQQFQYKYGKELIPTEISQKVELFYNKYLFFEKLYPIYFFTSLLLLGLIFIRLFSSKNFLKIKKILVYVIILSFIVHTINLCLRWYISGHAPWSNAYESMVFISWTFIFAGLFFVKKSEFALSSTTILASVLLFVAHLSWMDPQITTLTPSLKSIWLTIHVAVISASYGFLALSALLGFVTLILMILNKNNKNIIENINESFKTNELSMILGLVLLSIGTVLGSVWANESWGRIWLWDPKETWSLASILLYMMVLHLRFIPKLYTIYNFSVLSIVCYSTILMTYFGVNYFFDAIHVYASNTNSEIPVFVYFVVSFIFVIIIASYKNRKVEVQDV